VNHQSPAPWSRAAASHGGRLPLLGALAVWGPGLLVMLADADAGNVVTAAQAGAQWGYRLLPLLLALIPMPYLVQELTVRLGVHTGRG
jgi:Mn2+/Fe2+ NRAMP family transporter